MANASLSSLGPPALHRHSSSLTFAMNSPTAEKTLEGGCTCRFVRYRLIGKPLIVHCCHCTWCQRETGSAFAINALFPAEDVIHLNEEPITIKTPSLSGKGQTVARCPRCSVAVWSNYSGGGPAIRFVRVGTLDEPHELVPDVHIYTSTKVPWLTLPDGVEVFQEFYDVARVWAKETNERRFEVLERIKRGKGV